MSKQGDEREKKKRNKHVLSRKLWNKQIKQLDEKQFEQQNAI
jgi:hypothetical protein